MSDADTGCGGVGVGPAAVATASKRRGGDPMATDATPQRRSLMPGRFGAVGGQ